MRCKEPNFTKCALEGKAFLCHRVMPVSADPFCGDTPQRPESESADRFAVTGWKPRERPLAPVAENRDVQT